ALCLLSCLGNPAYLFCPSVPGSRFEGATMKRLMVGTAALVLLASAASTAQASHWGCRVPHCAPAVQYQYVTQYQRVCRTVYETVPVVMHHDVCETVPVVSEQEVEVCHTVPVHREEDRTCTVYKQVIDNVPHKRTVHRCVLE